MGRSQVDYLKASFLLSNLAVLPADYAAFIINLESKLRFAQTAPEDRDVVSVKG